HVHRCRRVFVSSDSTADGERRVDLRARPRRATGSAIRAGLGTLRTDERAAAAGVVETGQAHPRPTVTTASIGKCGHGWPLLVCHRAGCRQALGSRVEQRSWMIALKCRSAAPNRYNQKSACAAWLSEAVVMA